MNWLRELFDIEGWKKYSIALLSLLMGGGAMFHDDMSGGEFVGLVGVITAFFGAADVGAKWVNRQGDTNGTRTGTESNSNTNVG